jgi:hypothetical protein
MHQRIFNFSLLFIITIFSTLISNGQQKQLKVLFVGNSYTYVNNLPQIVSLISDSTNTKLITRKSVVGGAKLYEHWNGERGLKTKELIREGDFDIVVLQDYSMSAMEMPDSTHKYVKLFADFIRNSGAKPYLFNTWAREKVPQYQEIIDEMYARCETENNIERVPVGPAWELALKLRPTIQLFTVDGSHPSQMGTLLAACVFVATITGEISEKIPQSFWVKDSFGETLQIMYIEDYLDIEFCKRIVQQTVKTKSSE